MLGIADYFWRLIPANPILLRVVETKSKRRFDLLVRCGYLGVLVAIVIFSIVATEGTGSLSELAKNSAQLFQSLSYWQLGLVCFLAPIFTAGAITQEKDSQTYDILLATPLTNGQIVLGSMLSRLFFVVALLISGIPIFSITQIFGGVAIRAIVRSFGIAAATAFITGAIAMAIAVFKVGTRRTIFSFYLFIVVYMVGTFLLDWLPYFHFATSAGPSKTSWWTGLNPFLALRTIFNQKEYMPPDVGQLPSDLQGWPWGWYLSNPAGFYTSFMFFLSFVLVSPSIVLLRRLAQSHTSVRSWVLQKLRLSTGDRNRKPRSVWQNPIAWREAKTKASAARASMLRYGFIALGLIGALALLYRFASFVPPPYPDYIDTASYDSVHHLLTVYTPEKAQGVQTLPVTRDTSLSLNGNGEITIDQLRGKLSVAASVIKNNAGVPVAWESIKAFDMPRKLPASQLRPFLLGMTIIELAVILLIVTNAAASTVTREKEDGTLDLLLSTPITSRYYIWGKLRGLVSFVLPLIAVPVLSVVIFVVYDVFRRLGNVDDANFQWIVFPEAVLVMPAMLIIVAAFAAILGMQMSLRCRTTVMAVMLSVGIVVGLCAALGWCGYQLLQSPTAGSIGVIAGAFSPFTLLTMMIDPYTFADRAFGFAPGGDADAATSSRLLAFICTWVAVGAYTAVVWSMYKSMVKNFDMTIRKQSR
jgi:ABC-type transport system involved in multi-copper enzyme maturation permease subunit